MLIYALLLISVSYSSTHNIDETFQQKKDGALSINVVEYISPEDKKSFLNSLFFMGNEGTQVTFNVVLNAIAQGMKMDPNNHYFMIEKVDQDFLVTCDPSKAVGKVTQNGNDVVINGAKTFKDIEKGFLAAYMCSSTDNDYQIKGKITFQHPHGFIDTGYFGLIVFQFFSALNYFSMCCFWLWYMKKGSEYIMFHHKILAAVLIGSFLDSVIKTLTLSTVNNYIDGASSFIMGFGALFHGLRESLVRYIALMMARGWGMAQSQIDDKLNLQIYSVVYFIISTAYALYWNHLHHDYKQDMVEKNIILALCFFDALWATYVINSLRETYAALRDSHQEAKSAFYETFSYVIMGAIIMSIIFSLISIVFLNTSWRYSSWSQSWWYIDGCWSFQFGCVLSVFLYLFRPQKGSRYYADAQQLPQNEEDEEFGLEEFNIEKNYHETVEDASRASDQALMIQHSQGL